MQLKFQTKKLRYLKEILHETRLQEETCDSIVPDSYPDILAITDCYAYAVLRGKDCRDGSVVVSGGVKAALLYEPENSDTMQTMEMYLPFTVKIEHPLLTEGIFTQSAVRVCSVDAKIINSRKALLRVNLSTEIRAYLEADEMIYTLEEKCEELQTKENLKAIELAVESAEKSFIISETRELPVGNPSIDKIYQFSCHAELTDQKLVGDKAVFKGSVWCKILYFSDDGSLHHWNFKLPYSQYCGLTQSYDNETIKVFPVMTGCDYEIEQGTQSKSITVSVHMLAQCLITRVVEVPVIEDAYSTKGTLKAEWHPYEMLMCLDKQTENLSAQMPVDGQIAELLRVDVYSDQPEILRENETVKARLPYQVRLIGRDFDGKLCSFSGKTDACLTVALEKRANVFVNLLPVPEENVSLAGNGAEIRFQCVAETLCTIEDQFHTMCAGEILADEITRPRPSVLVRYIQQEETLWNIAKENKASLHSMQAVNRLENERVLSPGTVLLIPVG